MGSFRGVSKMTVRSSLVCGLVGIASLTAWWFSLRPVPQAAPTAAATRPAGRRATAIATNDRITADPAAEPADGRLSGLESTDPLGAALSITALPDGPEKAKLAGELAAIWAEENLPMAAEMVAAWGLQNAEVAGQAAAAVASAWALRDPPAAAAWVVTLPKGNPRAYAIENVVHHWSRVDPAAVLAWAWQLPRETDQSVALKALVGTFVRTDPDLALLLAEQVGNDDRQQRRLDIAARHWLARDPLAAEAWISSSFFPAEVKRRLLSQVRADMQW